MRSTLTLLTLLILAVLLSLNLATAQNNNPDAPAIDPRTGLPLNNPIKSELEKATELMVTNIKAALKAFKEINKPQEDKRALFDKLIGDISAANGLVADDGDLYKEIQSTVSTLLVKQKKWEGKARDPDTKADRRAVYKRLSLTQAENAKKVANYLTILLELQKELGDKIFDIQKDKEFYIDMIEAEQVKKATEVLDSVAISMSDVIGELDRLGAIPGKIKDFLETQK